MKNSEASFSQKKCLQSNTPMLKVDGHKDIQTSDLHLSPFIIESRFQRKKQILIKQQKKKRREEKKLKEIVERQKIECIKKQFVRKIKLLVPHKKIPQQLLLFRKEPNNKLDQIILKLEQMQGLKMSSEFLFLCRLIILLRAIIILVISSLQLVFQEVHRMKYFDMIIQTSILISIVDICMSFTFQKLQNNKNLTNILSIGKFYLKNDFVVDFFDVVTCILFRFTVNYLSIFILIMVCLIRLWRSLQRVQELQHLHVKSAFQQKYFSIGKVLFLNFLIAHIIAVIALLMANINQTHNWLTQKQIQNAEWIEKYVWAFYWAVNMMLTVGFGDITAGNYKEALVLIFVQTFSCVILAYNINAVGSILIDIKQKERQRKSQLRTILKMSQQNEVQNEIVEEAINYVDQSFKIKQKFCYQHHDAIIETLPKSIREEYIKHGNKKLILQSPLSNLFSNKSLMKLALIINHKLAHPEQFIWKRGQLMRLAILKKGKIGLVHRRGNSKLNGQVIQSMEINNKKSKLLSLNFLRNGQFYYDVKSLDYSVIYHLSQQQLAKALKSKNSDYQILCSFRDKFQFNLESGELHKCNFCQGENHDYFHCPKMHLVVMSSYTLYKNVLSKKNTKNARRIFIRCKDSKNYMKKISLLQNQLQNYCLVNNLTEQNEKPVRIYQNSNQSNFNQMNLSMKNNASYSYCIHDMDLQKLNSYLNAKMNEIELCVGFWDLQCDIAHNFVRYFPKQNPDYMNRQLVNKKNIRYNSQTLNSNQN